MKTCWTREQLQREVAKGKQQEEEDIVNYRHLDPARQSAWQKPGRYVSSQVGTGGQNEVGVFPCPPTLAVPTLTKSQGSPPGQLCPFDAGELAFRGEARTIAADRSLGLGGPCPRALSAPQAHPQVGAPQASPAAAASARLRGCGSGRAGRAIVPAARLPAAQAQPPLRGSQLAG